MQRVGDDDNDDDDSSICCRTSLRTFRESGKAKERVARCVVAGSITSYSACSTERNRRAGK